MTHFMLTNESMIYPNALSKRSSQHVYLFTRNSILGDELGAQLQFFGYEPHTYATIEAVKEGLRWQYPRAILILVEDTSVNFQDIEAINEVSTRMVKRIPLIIVSTQDDFWLRLKAVRAGASAFISGPVDIGNIIGQLDELSSREESDPYRILVVEDTITQASFYAMHLEKVGMETRIVTQPSALMSVLVEFNPDLILMDIYMPDCTGIELAQVIRHMENFVSVPIVYLSAETDKERQLAAMLIGGDDFIIKPIKPEHLVASVTSRVDRYRRMRTLMLSDGLTGLLNHTAIKERLVQEVQRANREHQELSFVMIDLDLFKSVNDIYGHTTGDRVLKSLARLLKQRLRRTDLIGRYGGEEFAIILPNTSPEEAARVLDKLRDSFSKIVHRSGEKAFTVTFSAGVACFPDYKSPQAITHAADRGLYEAKHHGRNQVFTIRRSAEKDREST